jgi:E3 ubiquitin-protein ligase RNF216
MAIVDADDPSTFVQCQECMHKVCPRCKDDPHEGQPSCERAKAEKEQSNAHSRMADAMTKAVMRFCPGCKTSIVKSEGCNKMTCPRESCKTQFCYICRQVVADYSHFCQTPHCNHASCGKCVLFASTDEDDRQARRDAGKRAREELGAAAENFALLSPERKEKAKLPRTLLDFFKFW